MLDAGGVEENGGIRAAKVLLLLEMSVRRSNES